MTDPIEYCPDCAQWHPGRPCGHNADLMCYADAMAPAHPRGFRFTGDDGQAHRPATTCWRCANGLPDVQ